MVSKISFFTPIKYESSSFFLDRLQGYAWPSVGQRLVEWADDYFYLGGRVAIADPLYYQQSLVAGLVPGYWIDGSEGVIEQEQQEAMWKTLLKVISYATLIFPILLFTAKLILRSIYHFHVCQRSLPNDSKEIGLFDSNVLTKGVRIEGDNIAFIYPKIQKAGIEINGAEWLRKAFFNDPNFTNNEFLQLPMDLRNEIQQIANIYVHEELLQRIRECEMISLPEVPEGPALFSYNMNALAVKDTLHAFLCNLRQNNLLFTAEEFALQDRFLYHCKYDDIGRILGRDYIERTAKHLNLKHIKVPKKLAVISKNCSSIKFGIYPDGYMQVFSNNLTIYAEKIQRVHRKARREEVLEFLTLVDAVGFNDFIGGDNFFIGKNQVGEEGIYLIDTEYKNFSELPSYNKIMGRYIDHTDCLPDYFINNIIGHLKYIMKPQDHPWLYQEIGQRYDRFKAERRKIEKDLHQKWQSQKSIFIKNGFMHRYHLNKNETSRIEIQYRSLDPAGNIRDRVNGTSYLHAPFELPQSAQHINSTLRNRLQQTPFTFSVENLVRTPESQNVM